VALTDDLRSAAAATWERAVDHPFVRELGSGRLPRDKFKRYFLQDYVFVDELRRVTGLAVARAPDIETSREFGRFLSVLLGAEDAIFTRAFADLGVAVSEYGDVSPHATTRAFSDFLVRTAYEGSFEEICCALYVTEGVYLDWATRLRSQGARPGVPVYEEWIQIHGQETLGPFVGFLKGVVDSAAVGALGKRRFAGIFETALGYEVAFWDMAFSET
jgi:thiaminase/transcriptional activator TenA